MENYPMPQIVDATRKPFTDTIIHDGIVAPYAWNGYDFEDLNKLDEKDYIRQGSHRSKFMYITKEGEAKAKELMAKYNVADW